MLLALFFLYTYRNNPVLVCIAIIALISYSFLFEKNNPNDSSKS